MVFAYSDAKVGTMDSEFAVQIMYADEIAKDSSGKKKADMAAQYDALAQSAASAATRGYVDQIIEKPDTRKHIIYAFEMLYTKRETRLSKKHGTV